MLRRKKPAGDAAQPLLTAARDFETSLIDQMRRSERRAWRVAMGAGVMSLLLAGGYGLVMPLKEQVPYLVLADPYRGTSSVARLEAGDTPLSASEAINKSNVAHFVIARESYDWELLNRRDRRVVHAMATDSALKEYVALYTPSHPDNPDTLYGKNASVRIKILSTVLTWGDATRNGTGVRTPIAASVRFERWLFDKATGQARPLDTRLATMKVSYDPHLQMNEEGRIENPLGFRVHSYRVDPEVSGATPPNVPVPVSSPSPPVESAGTWPTVADPALTGNTALPMQTGGTHAARM